MKVAILCTNINSFDEIWPPKPQEPGGEFELFYYTENTLPFPLPHLNSRMKGKYFKTQAHKFLDHDIFICMDGSVEIISEKLVTTCIENLRYTDITISLHEQRSNVYEELLHIIEEMKVGNPYLLKRYAKEPFYQEYDFYKKEDVPKAVPLYNCFFFARWNNEIANKMFDHWWDMILRYSNFDQTAFSYVAWKAGVNIHLLETEGLIIRHRHREKY